MSKCQWVGMAGRDTFHHGALRTALIDAALVEIERAGVENLSLRELAQQLGVARSAPYRHFESKKALLEAVASIPHARLYEIYSSLPPGLPPQTRLYLACKAYLDLTRDHPRLIQLLFIDNGDLEREGVTRPSYPQSALTLFMDLVRDAMSPADEAAVEMTTLACWSVIHGFAMLRIGGRLAGFQNSDAEAAILDRVLVLIDRG
jgi:AcrR family transcriptional regulator